LENPFYQFAVILSITAGMGAMGSLLRQPLIVMFIFVGICVGPSWLGIATLGTEIEILSRMGIALLLFLVGLRLDLQVIRNMGPVALATGLGQVLFTSVIGFVIGLLLGLDVVAAVYVAVALTFSSTIIIVKLLSDKREIDAVLGVDFDPQVIAAWRKHQYPVQYGDAEDPEGDAAEAIQRLVRKLEIDLLVMGTVCRTGIPGFLIGNTAERVLDVVDCSVLVVKPVGFVSPVAALISK